MDLLPTLSATSQLEHYHAACMALSKATRIDEVREIRSQAEALRAYAKQADNRQLEIDAAEIRIRATRRVGELIAAQREAGLLHGGGRPKTGGENPPVSEAPITLSEAGINKDLAKEARSLAAMPEERFEAALADRRERLETSRDPITVGFPDAGEAHGGLWHRTIGTGQIHWFTPQRHVELARAVLGGIDLDPASTEQANRVVKAAAFFTEETNGLDKPWHGRVWLNPPYSRALMKPFCEKMVAEWQSGRVTAGIALSHNFADTGWFQTLARAASAACFSRGRVPFYDPDGEIAAPVSGQTFFYFGPDPRRFEMVFSEVGIVYVTLTRAERRLLRWAALQARRLPPSSMPLAAE